MPGRLSQAEMNRLRPYGEPVPFDRPALARKPLAVISDAEIWLVRTKVSEALGHNPERPLCCHDIAFALARFFDDARPEGGRFIGPRGPGQRWGRRGDPHTWVRLTNGSLLDSSADQYGHPPILRLAAGDPRQAWYEVRPPLISPDGTWKFPHYAGDMPYGAMWPDERRAGRR